VHSNTRSKTPPTRATIGTPDPNQAGTSEAGRSTVLARPLPTPIKFEGFYHTNFRNLLRK
jgi:hypothetical protein